MALKTRKPTGKVPPPVVLVEGDEGAGKSWSAALLSASDKVGQTAWLQVGFESTADQYGLIPGVRYEILEHDGTWATIYGSVCDAKTEAEQARKRGDKPFVLVIDQIGGIWDMLSEWANNRARSSVSNKEKLARDPNVEIDITPNYWNDATARWRKLMTALLTFPGIVIIVARGRETVLIENGKPNPKKKDYRVEGHKSMAFDVPAWVRMTRDGNPVLVKLRSVSNPRQGEQRVRPLPGFSLEKFIFETMGYDAGQLGEQAMVPMQAGSEAPQSEFAAVLQLAIESAESMEQLTAAFHRIKPALEAQKISESESEQLTAFASGRRPEFAAAVVAS
jgi:AAA domain